MSGGPPSPHKMVPTFKFIQNMSKRHHGTTLDPLPLDMTSEASLEKKSQEDPPPPHPMVPHPCIYYI